MICDSCIYSDVRHDEYPCNECSRLERVDFYEPKEQEQERKRARIQPFDGVRGGARVLVPDGTGGAHSRTIKFKRRGKFRTHAGKNTLQTGEIIRGKYENGRKKRSHRAAENG